MPDLRSKSRFPPRTERILLTCGAIGAPLFVVILLIEGSTRAHYSPLRHPVSSLSIGECGWVQMTNFVVTGTLMIAFGIGLFPAIRREGGGIWVPLLIGLFGTGLIGAGIFVADPISGFPPGSPMLVEIRSTNGRLHDVFGIPVFLGLPVACGVLAYRFARTRRKGWAVYTIGTAAAFMVCFFLAGLGFDQNPTLMPIGGLLQRLTIIIGWTWLTVVAVYVLRRLPEPAPGESG